MSTSDKNNPEMHYVFFCIFLNPILLVIDM